MSAPEWTDVVIRPLPPEIARKRAESAGIRDPAYQDRLLRMTLKAVRYYHALTQALPLAGSRSLRDGPTVAELTLETDFERQIATPLLGLYQQPLPRLEDLIDMSEPEIVGAVLGDYAARPAGVRNLGEMYHDYARRAFNLGGQMGLNELGLLGRFEATDGRVLDEIDATSARLTELESGAERSTVVTTAKELGRQVTRQRADGLDAADMLPLLSAWVLGRTIIRSANIAATESVRMTRWGMVWAFTGNGIRGVRHLCESHVLDRCGGAICPPLCGVEYELPGIFNPLGAIPGAGLIPLHPRCRCSYEPLTDGWLKPTLIWTGFALDLLLDDE